MAKDAVLVRCVSRAWLRAGWLSVPSVAALLMAIGDDEGRNDLGLRFAFFFFFTLIIVSPFLRSLLKACLRAEGPIRFTHRTKQVSLRDEDMPVLAQVLISILGSVFLALKVPESAGILAGFFAGLSVIF